MVDKPLVSVIIPTYNRAVLVKRAIQSILDQTYDNFEVIVVDDASTDSTVTVIANIEDERLKYIRHEVNGHASAARNTGIASAKGELIAFLDDDDEWFPSKLEKQVPVLVNASPEVGLVYCWMDYFDSSGRLVGETHPTHTGWVFDKMLDRPRLGGCPTIIVRREVFDVVGVFDVDLRRGNDGDFIRRVAREYAVDVVPEVLVRVNVGHDFDRITTGDEQGIRNAIKGHQVKLTKFADELDSYPKQTASILSAIGHHHAQLGEWITAAGYFLRAVRRAPSSGEPYRMLAYTLKERFSR